MNEYFKVKANLCLVIHSFKIVNRRKDVNSWPSFEIS